jgi:adenylate cyclase
LLLAAACAGHLGEHAIGAAMHVRLKAMVLDVSAAWIEATSPYVLAQDRARLAEGLHRAAAR